LNTKDQILPLLAAAAAAASAAQQSNSKPNQRNDKKRILPNFKLAETIVTKRSVPHSHDARTIKTPLKHFSPFPFPLLFLS
jgi:hypothetical protein